LLYAYAAKPKTAICHHGDRIPDARFRARAQERPPGRVERLDGVLDSTANISARLYLLDAHQFISGYLI
jgi:hypothetical protein